MTNYFTRRVGSTGAGATYFLIPLPPRTLQAHSPFMSYLISEHIPEWVPGCSSVPQLQLLKPWVTGSPPICFLLVQALPAEKPTMGMGWGSYGRCCSPSTLPPPLILIQDSLCPLGSVLAMHCLLCETCSRECM